MLRKRLMTEVNLSDARVRRGSNLIHYSEEIRQLFISNLENKYGNSKRCHEAATIIQQAYRHYKLHKKWLKSSSPKVYQTNTAKNRSMPDNLDFCTIYNSLDHKSTVRKNMLHLLQLLAPEKVDLCLDKSSPCLNRSTCSSESTEQDLSHQESVTLNNTKWMIGDMLSTKCDDDLENCLNDPVKTDDSDTSSNQSEFNQLEDLENKPSTNDSMTITSQHPITDKLPPPMPVINTLSIFNNTAGHCYSNPQQYKMSKLSSKNVAIDLSPFSTTTTTTAVSSTTTSYRSPRDSGVSSHSSNTDLLTIIDPNSMPPSSCLHLRSLSYTAPTSTTAHNFNAESRLPGGAYLATPIISEDTDSLFDNSNLSINNNYPSIPSCMTSSKDSGVDADVIATTHHNNITTTTNNSNINTMVASNSINKRISLQLHPQKCTSNLSVSMIQPRPSPNSPVKSSLSTTSPPPSISNESYPIQSSHPESFRYNPSNQSSLNNSINYSLHKYSDLIVKILHRIAINLFNRSSSVGLDYVHNHKLFNVKCPYEMAVFLRNKDIHPQVVTDFLSKSDCAFNISVLRCYLNQLTLKGLSFLEAFDYFISNIKLPDETGRLKHMITEFSQHYTRNIHKIPGIDLSVLENLARIIVLLRSSSVNHTRSSKSLTSVGRTRWSSRQMGFNEFVKLITTCFKGLQCPYNMDMLQNIYIGVTRSCQQTNTPTERLVSRMDNLDDAKSYSNKKSGSIMSRSHFMATHRRLTYWCDVVQLISQNSLSNSRKQSHHSRTLLLFNDSLILAKKPSMIGCSSQQVTTSFSSVEPIKFHCRFVISFLNYQVDFKHTQVYNHEIRLQSTINNFILLDCGSHTNCDKLLNRLLLSQLECRAIEHLRLHQWYCTNYNNSKTSSATQQLQQQQHCFCINLINNTLGYYNNTNK